MKRIALKSWAWYESFYTRFAKVLLVVCLLTATGGVIIGTTAQIESGQNTAATRSLVECLVDHGKASNEATAAVRKAAEAKDLAVGEFNATLQAEGLAFLALVTALANPATAQKVYDPLLKTLRETLAARATANQKVIRKQLDLDAARQENPVPAPPATFCGLDRKE